jgi:hypothetical protein
LISQNSSRRGKRSKNREEEKEREVVHVRARRGQATDSHSIAERVKLIFSIQIIVYINNINENYE